MKSPTLYKHQQDILTADPKRTGLFLGTGSGKTLTALLLAQGKTLVICPKTQKEDRNWERECQKNKILLDLTVMSKEEFRKTAHLLRPYDTLIIDEAHTCLGVTPNTCQRNKVIMPKASQLFEALAAYIARTRPERFYFCTATIIRSPFTVWAAYVLLKPERNTMESFYSFRDKWYVRLPMAGREVWRAKSDDASKDSLANLVRSLGYIGRLEDFFDVPDQTFRTIHTELSERQKNRIKQMTTEYPEPIVRVGKIHQIENGVLAGDEFNAPEVFENAKISAILDLCIEFPRIVVFAKYKAQIAQIASAVEKTGRKVLCLTGETKERGEVIREAQEASECVFIAQAQISAGWELPDYPVMVFASRSYSFVDYSQALGRIQRANNIKKNLYINLVTKGGVDEALDKCILNKQDFDERIYLQKP